MSQMAEKAIIPAQLSIMLWYRELLCLSSEDIVPCSLSLSNKDVEDDVTFSEGYKVLYITCVKDMKNFEDKG